MKAPKKNDQTQKNGHAHQQKKKQKQPLLTPVMPDKAHHKSTVDTTNTMYSTTGNDSIIPSVHGSDASVSSYKTLQNSFAKTRRLTHPDTKAKEHNYKMSLTIPEMVKYAALQNDTYMPTLQEQLSGWQNSSTAHMATEDKASSNHTINWDATMPVLIKALRNHIKNNKEHRVYFNSLITRLQNSNLYAEWLFHNNDTVYTLLAIVLDFNLDSNTAFNITYTDSKGDQKCLQNVKPKIVYKTKSIADLYYIHTSILLDEVTVNTGKGEVAADKDGEYPELKAGQWKAIDRIQNPDKEDSSFWKAAVYNTQNHHYYLYKTIAQRNAYYKFADVYLNKQGITSEWFEAADKVTMYSPFTGEVAVGAAERLNATFLSNDTEQFLAAGNTYLFYDNMYNVKLLLEGKGLLHTNFTDPNNNAQSFKGLKGKALDLKLVEFEQSLVQDFIESYKRELDNTYEERHITLLRDTPKETYKGIIGDINDSFNSRNFGWAAEDHTQDIMDAHFTDKNGKGTFNFTAYNHRVQLGQLLVEELYYLRQRDAFKTQNFDKIEQTPMVYAQKPEHKDLVYDKNLVPPPKPKKIKDYITVIKKEIQRIKNIYNHREKLGLGIKELKKIMNNLLATVWEDITKLKQEFTDINYNDIIELIQEFTDTERLIVEPPPLLESEKEDTPSFTAQAAKYRDQTAANLLIAKAKALLPNVAEIGDSKKETYFKISSNATVAILLYEFAAGEGKPLRHFDYGSHPFANEVLNGRVLQEILNEGLELLQHTRYDFKTTEDSIVLRPELEFSPPLNMELPSFLLESIDKHLDSNLAQFFIGGALVYFQIKNGIFEGYITNDTSRNSLLLHLASNIDRNPNEKPKKLSTIKQRIHFKFKLPAY